MMARSCGWITQKICRGCDYVSRDEEAEADSKNERLKLGQILG
jgi:hypothetical protein